MFFSLITPADGREREAAHRGPSSTYAEHQWLWGMFSAPQGTPRDFLFRRSQVDGLPRFYVVSHREPQPMGDTWQIHSRRYKPQIQAGDRLGFELRANPSVRHGRDGKSKRHDVVMETKKRLLAERGLTRWADLPAREKPDLHSVVQQSCIAWLTRRSIKLGFTVNEESVVVEGYEQRSEQADRSLQFSTVDLRGELTVADPPAFVGALFDGIGSAKAFGCGLLLVRPMS